METMLSSRPGLLGIAPLQYLLTGGKPGACELLENTRQQTIASREKKLGARMKTEVNAELYWAG